MTLKEGTKFGHYEILSPIGAGGMGEVYLAEDTRLDRKVAVKFLKEEFSRDADKLNRFIQEAKAVSALNHPNILTVFEIGETDGAHFIATEFIEGKTLREQLAARGAMPLNEILKIGVQIAEALAAAHQAGIVHRDIKPENIMIRRDGYVKVLDFGLAKLAEKRSEDLEAVTIAKVNTVPGIIMGTPSYMSPEQARGKTVDRQTDIFSFGVLLYEMLSGSLPFDGETVSDVIASILTKEPKPLREINREIPAELEEIVNRASRKDKQKRYRTAEDLLTDLKDFKQDLELQSRLESSIPPRRTEAQTEILKAVKTAEETPLTGVAARKNSIAVLPFINVGGDPNMEYLSEGISESIINSLSKLPQLKVIARSSSFKYKDADAEEAARVLGVKTIVTGRIRRFGDDLQVSAEVMNAGDNTQIWGEQYVRHLNDLLQTQLEISREIAESLRLQLSDSEQFRLEKAETVSPEAYELLLKGRFYWNKGGTENRMRGVDYFNRSIAADANYALAYAELSAAYRSLVASSLLNPAEFTPKAEEFALKALSLDANLPEAHLALAWLRRDAWAWREAEDEFEKTLRLNTNFARAHNAFAYHLSIVGRHDRAVAEISRVKELDPASPVTYANVATILYFARRYEEALAALGEALELDKNYPNLHTDFGYIYAAQGKFEKAADAFSEAVKLGNSSPSTRIFLGMAYARAGDQERANAILRELEQSENYVSPGELAILYGGLGEPDKAFASLEKAYAQHDLQLQYLGNDPAFDTLREDERFKNLLKRIGLSTGDTAQNKSASEAMTVIISPAVTDASKNYSIGEIDAQTSPDEAKAKRKRWRFGLLGLVILSLGFFAYLYFAPASKQIESIAVMPFVNESGNQDAEYLSDGMTETLIGSLSQLPNLSVKARSSVFRYKGKEIDPKKIALELNVQAILNGRITQRGDQLTLSLELIDAQTENVIWSESYNRKQTDLVSLQSEIARDVSSKIKTKLSGADEKQVAKTYTTNPEAYKFYLQGRFYWNKREEKDFRKAVEYYNQAIALDPNYALAFAGLADTYALLATFGLTPPSEGMTKAREFAHRALSLDESLAEPHATLGVTLLSYGYDFAGAEREYRRAIELNPNYLTAHQWYGELLTCLSRFDEAAAEYRRALEIDPLSLPANWEYARFFYYARRFDEAIAQHRKVRELDPRFQGTHRTLAEVYRVKGNYAKAIEEQAGFYELSGEPQNAAMIREAFVKDGWNGFLRLVTEENSPLKLRHAVVARAYLELGEKDKAFAELNKAYEMRESPIQWLKVEPQFDPLRDDPRFEELLRKVGFPR